MPKLYSYRMTHDKGSAPNPYGGTCTLVICKPEIRRSAKVGDWIVGTGSSRFGFENRVIYAMEVTQKMTMQEYDEYCKENLPCKIPNWKSRIFEEKIGDCIYDFSTNTATIRLNLAEHDESYREHDCSGVYALLSNHFYYFGRNPLQLKGELLKIIKKGPGHKSDANDKYFHLFVDWVMEQEHAKNRLFDEPYLKPFLELNLDKKNQCNTTKSNNSFDKNVERKTNC